MTFNLSAFTKDFSSALSAASSVINKAETIPVLKAIRITVANGRAELVGTNTQQTVIVNIEAEGSGSICIDAASLEAKIKSLNQTDFVRIAEEDGFVIVSQKRTRWKTPALPADDFPDNVASPVDGKEVDIPALFMPALKSVSVCVDPAEPREYLRGVRMADALVGTDGRSLAVAGCGAVFDGVTVPLVAVAAISKLSGDIVATASDKAIQFSTDRMTIKTQVIDAGFPEYRRIIPSDLDGLAIVDRQELLAAITRASAIRAVGEKSGAFVPVALRIRSSEIEIASENRDGEEGADYVSCDRQSGADCDIRFSGALITRALNSLDCEVVELAFHDHMSPILIRPVGDGPENIRIVMPRQK